MKSELEQFSTLIRGLKHFSFENIVFEIHSDGLQDDNCFTIGLYGMQGSGQ